MPGDPRGRAHPGHCVNAILMSDAARKPRTPRTAKTGITPTPFGYRAFVRVRGQLFSKRFPPETSLSVMEGWRQATRVDVLRAAGPTPPRGTSTFAEDVATYLRAVSAMATYAERAYHLDCWIAVLGGHRPRRTITSDEMRAALQTWRLSGRDGRPLSESACNHRRSALMHLYTVLDGKASANPVKNVPRFREPDPEPRGVSYAILRTVLAAMPESKTKARIRVLMWTGLPPSSLKQIRPEDIQWAHHAVYVPRRRKGYGTRGRILPLLPEAVRAFQALSRWDAFGPFSTDALRHSWLRACKTVGVAPIRIYDLRHSFGSAAYAASGDIRAVQSLLDHSDVKLTERYTLGAVDARVQQTLRQLRKVTRPVTTGRRRKKSEGKS